MDHLKFKEALRELGISQHAFAREIDMDITTVNRWANGKAIIPGIAKAYVRLRLQIDQLAPRKGQSK
jgi:DNA-binding transcriptional regulator YiaG